MNSLQTTPPATPSTASLRASATVTAQPQPSGLMAMDGSTTTKPPAASASQTQRAESAASWLLSSERNIIGMSSDYGLRHDPATGTDSYQPIATRFTLDTGKLNDEVRARLVSLLGTASRDEITTHLARLEMHRRKAGLGEAGLPAFLEDVASDLLALRVSSLGMALLARHLRTNARNQWFPAWDEIEAAALKIEAGLKVLKAPATQMIEVKAQPQQEQSKPQRPLKSYVSDWLELSRKRHLSKDELQAWTRGEQPPEQ